MFGRRKDLEAESISDPKKAEAEPPAVVITDSRALLESAGVRIHGFVDAADGVRFAHDRQISSARVLGAYLTKRRGKIEPEQERTQSS